MTGEQLYSRFKTKMQKIADVRFASAVLQWDQETCMPPAGAQARGSQIATLSEISHSLFTEEDTRHILEELATRNDLTERQQRNVALTLADLKREQKLPSEFVHRMAETVNRCFHAWLQARKENQFSFFSKPLEELIDLKRQQAEFIGFSDHPYDALLDEYDRGLTVKQLDSMFSGLTPRLKIILDKITDAVSPDTSMLYGHFEKQKQWDFGISLLKEMHYDFEAGRQDISEHPFTIHFGSRDVRVTTRIDETDFSNMTWSCLHEGGHALYEQGLPEEEYGLPLGESCSLSIHESQSRLWENCIGRSRPYWQYHFSALKNIFPERLGAANTGSFFRAINKVIPSLIRTEADEVTYHFHVLIRYELEKELISRTVSPADIPARWNELYKMHLGVTVPDDKQGCLQDVHWSHGSFGYFPTYSLGSLYAAQFFDAIKKKHADLDALVAAGKTKPVWNWLQENIYKHGRYYNSADLCRQATGEDLNPNYFIDYITKKVAEVYGIDLPNN